MTQPAALTLAQELEQDRAKMAAALARVYRTAGFPAAVSIHQGLMRALIEQVRQEGGDALGEWIT